MIDTQKIIHISGVSGSGKSTMAEKLTTLTTNSSKGNVIIKDLDELRSEFIKSYYSTNWTYIDEGAYQKYIDSFIDNHPRKVIIFVGLNDNTRFGKNKDLYYDLRAVGKYFIDIDDDIALIRKCKRLMNSVQNDPHAMDDLINNNDKFRNILKSAIDVECNYELTKEQNKKWRADYQNMGYTFGSFDVVEKLVTEELM